MADHVSRTSGSVYADQFFANGQHAANVIAPMVALSSTGDAKPARYRRAKRLARAVRVDGLHVQRGGHGAAASRMTLMS
jgi:hypothetical protein